MQEEVLLKEFWQNKTCHMARRGKIDDRIILLHGEINSSNTSKCIENIILLSEESEEPIRLYINSSGGNVYDGFGLVGIIESLKVPLHTFAFGQIMSMALPIFASGKVRYSSPYTTYMYHGIAWNTHYEKLEWHKQETLEGDRIQGIFDKIILKRSKIEKSILDNVKHTKSEWYFDTSQAKKMGLVDHIL